ncbi:MAG TPA: 3-carboxy-cis,cis-muconate cycloisomerase [Thermomicrobiales bacterium]|nr:3-carboxy-cis,cis-muconate cycloisomerase [Thermomicrobiales bacterium]
MGQTRELFAAPTMAAIFSNEAHIQAMLDFEGALARAEARAGVIPAAAAQAISDVCRVELYDVAAVIEQARAAGAHSIPLVAALAGLAGSDAGRYVHWGATSQDVIDTALMLQARAGLDWLLAELLAIGARCAALAQQHRLTPMAGRTLTQHATPTSFGLKSAHWLSAVTRQIERLQRVRAEGLALQFGGAVGTLSALGDAGPSVLEQLAQELGLPQPDLPWHTDRDRVAALAAALSLVAGVMAKIATDLLLLSQTEVAEVSEGVVEGKGGSSAMPHKRNPAEATFALAAARMAQGQAAVVMGAMAHEHERAAGAWHAEWVALPDAFVYTAGAVERVQSALSGLTVDASRMRANLDLTGGLILTEALTTVLAERVGRPEAFRLVKDASDRSRAAGRHLRDIAQDDAAIAGALTAREIERAFDPARHLGSASLFIERAVERFTWIVERLNAAEPEG